MGENALSAAAALAVLFALGAWVRRRSHFENVGLAEPLVTFVLGASCAAGACLVLVVFDATLTALRLTVLATAAALVVGAIVSVIGRRDRLAEPAEPAVASPGAARITTTWWLVAAAIVAYCVVTIEYSNILPIIDSDELKIWAAKAHVLFGASGSDADVVDGLRGRLSLDGRPSLDMPVAHADYPWLASLLQCWMHGFAGEIARVTPRLPLQVAGACALLAWAECVRRCGAPVWFAAPLVLTSIVRADFRVHLGMAAAESLVLVGCVLLLLARGRSRATERGITTFALLILATGKNEGVALVACWSLLEVVFAGRCSLRARIARLAPALPALVAVGAWWTFNHQVGLSNDLVAAATKGASGLYPLETLQAIWNDVLFAPWRNVFVPLLAALALVWSSARRRAREPHWSSGPAAYALAFWLCGSAIYALAFATTPHDFERHWDTAGPRVWANLLPFASIALASSVAVLSRAPAEH
jgi:hypothetical protein